MFGHSYTGHSEWCDDNDGLELVEDIEINENIDEFYDLEDSIEDEDGMIQDSDFNDFDEYDPDDEDEVIDLEDDVHDE